MSEYTRLPADLPEDWAPSQIVTPKGVEAGLPERYGYNYLMKQVNEAQRAINKQTAAIAELREELAKKVNGTWSFYSHQNQLGIEIGDETIPKIVRAMPARSTIQQYVYVNVGFADVYPYPAGTLYISKISSSRAVIQYYHASAFDMWVGSYYEESDKWLGWKKIVLE